MYSIRRLFTVLLMTSTASIAFAQSQSENPIMPPQGGIPIISGGYYAAGTQFANGMAYPPGSTIPNTNMIIRTLYQMPMANPYQSNKTTYNHDYGILPQREDYRNFRSTSGWSSNPGISQFSENYRFNDPGFTTYSGFSDYNRGWQNSNMNRSVYGSFFNSGMRPSSSFYGYRGYSSRRR